MRHLIDLFALGTVYAAGLLFCVVYVAVTKQRGELAAGLGANRRLARVVALMPAVAAFALFVSALWLTLQVWG